MSIIGNAILLGGGGGGAVVVWDELDVHGGTIRHIEAANTYSSGDNLSYGTAGISDLTGTTWYFNETLTDTLDGQYALSFASNNNNYTTLVLIPGAMMYGLTTFAYSNTWSNQAYRTISITGGTDATNADLIAWLEANATEVTS